VNTDFSAFKNFRVHEGIKLQFRAEFFNLFNHAQFYLGEIAYSQKNYDLAVSEYDKVLTGYPRSFKTAPARLKKALANIELNQKATGVRELREIIKRYPGTEEDRRARAKLKEMGASLSASQ